MGQVRGGLAMAVIAACTAFGAICGSSVATTATFGRAALPELLRHGYEAGFATGTHRGRRHARHPDPALGDPGDLRHHGGAEHQPPVHGGLRTRPAGRRCSIWSPSIWWRAGKPDAAPRSDRRARRALEARQAGVAGAAGRAVVVGGIYGGVFSPTEGAAVGDRRPSPHRPGAALGSAGPRSRPASSTPPPPPR